MCDNHVDSLSCCQRIGSELDFSVDSLLHCCIYVNAKALPVICAFNGGEFPLEAYLESCSQYNKNNMNNTGNCSGCVDLTAGTPNPPFNFFKLVTFNHFTACQLNCSYCQQGNAVWRKRKITPYPLLTTLSDMAQKKLINTQTFFGWGGGEPTLYDYFDETFNFLMQNGYAQGININTNAIVFSETIANGLANGRISATISIDSGTPETYQRIKGGNTYCFQTVWENIKKYNQYGNVGVKYIVMPDNADEVNTRSFIENCCNANIKVIYISTELNAYNNNSYSVRDHNICVNAARTLAKLAISHNIQPHLFHWKSKDIDRIKRDF